MTAGNTSQKVASHLVAREPEDGFTRGNADYLQRRYEFKGVIRTDTDDEGVTLHVAKDKVTGEEVLIKEHAEPAIEKAETELAALHAIHSPRVLKLKQTVRVREQSATHPG